MTIKQKINKVLKYSEELNNAIACDEWARAADVFQQRDGIIHELLDNTLQINEQDSVALRGMISELQKHDQVLIDKVTKGRDKLVDDVVDAAAGQRAVEAYSKNI